MLADGVIEAAFAMKDMAPAQRHCYETLAEKLRHAPRYVLDRGAVHFVQTTAEMNPDRFLAALKICRMPFPSMWVEFAYQDRKDWLDGAVARGLSVTSNPNAYPPSRLGFYLEQQGSHGRIMQVTPVWAHDTALRSDKNDEIAPISKSGMISICSLSQQIDTSDNVMIDPIRLAKIRENVQSDLKHHLRRAADTHWRDSTAQKAWLELETRIRPTIADFMKNFWLWVHHYKPQIVGQLRELAEFDLLAEWRFILALLIIMNSRNIISVGDEIDYVRLNKSRLLKRKSALLSYRPIMLSLSRVQQNRLRTSNHADLAAHIVEGHWKVRKTGLYYWSTHARGSVGTPLVPTRKVTA